ncbi:MAG: hypothetical protein KKD17_02835 [Nanoarchaeota archaeon]|nr:hypothetical protein [Nanoarchaeota archaeon]
MLDEQKIEQSSRIIRELISEGKIVRPKAGTDIFFLQKSRESLDVSQRLMELQDEEGLPTNLWVINTSYYSMFFAATALLAKFSHRIKTESGIHRLTYHALVHYFMKEENRLKKHFMEEYELAVDEAENILQLSENRIEKLVKDLDFEMAKRKEFTYEMGKIAEKSKAETSLSRARKFFIEIEKVMNI